MKLRYLVLPACLIFIALHTVTAGNGNAKLAPALATGKSADFAGIWKGTEQCQAVSAPIAIVNITTDGPDQVFITGVYSLSGKIRGVVKGNTLTIPRQAVTDPNFTNIEIEGSFTMGSSGKLLTGVFTIVNNNTRDGCTVNYHR